MTKAGAFPTTPDRRQVVIGGILLAAAATVPLLRPSHGGAALSDDGLERWIPTRIRAYHYAGSSGLVVPAQEEMAARSIDHLVTRIYAAPDLPPVMMLVAYERAQDVGLALHRPEACYPSAGYHMAGRALVPLSGVAGERAVALSAERGDQHEQIYTWMRIGSRFPTSALQEKMAIITSNLRGYLPDGVLVRLSVRSTDRAGSIRQMMAFNAALLDAMRARGRAALLGEGSSR